MRLLSAIGLLAIVAAELAVGFVAAISAGYTLALLSPKAFVIFVCAALLLAALNMLRKLVAPFTPRGWGRQPQAK